MTASKTFLKFDLEALVSSIDLKKNCRFIFVWALIIPKTIVILKLVIEKITPSISILSFFSNLRKMNRAMFL